MARRNPDDKLQQRIAWHELGHALVAKKLHLKVRAVVHTVDGGWTDVFVEDHQWREDAIFCMAGSAGEWLWEKHHSGWFGSRSHCNGDLELFRKAVQGHRFSEGQARAEARRILQRHRDRLERLASQLITAGRLSSSQL